METSNKDKSVKTIPKGVWEGTHPDKPEKQSIRTDLQGNGYPTDKQSK